MGEKKNHEPEKNHGPKILFIIIDTARPSKKKKVALVEHSHILDEESKHPFHLKLVLI